MINLDTADNLMASAFGAGAFDTEYRPRLVKDGTDSWDVLQDNHYLGAIFMYGKAEYYIAPIKELRSPHFPDGFDEAYASLDEALADFTCKTRHPYMRGARNGQPINW